jgi:hypothetical protein
MSFANRGVHPMRPLKSAPSPHHAEAQGEPSPAAIIRWTEAHGWLTTMLITAVVLLAANYKLVAGKAVPIYDALDDFLPGFVLQADSVGSGQLLLWNPWTNAGCPAAADPQALSYSPIATFIGLQTGGTESGFCIYWLSIRLIAGLGILALGRHLGAPPWGAVIAALGFTFSGFFIGNAENAPMLYTMSLFPFVIWRLDAALQRRRFWPAVQAGAFWGLSALGGYPALIVLGGCLAALWILGRLVCGYPESVAEKRAHSLPPPSGRRGHWSFGVAALAVLALTGILVLSPAYVAFFADGAGYTDRTGGLARETATGSEALHPRALTTFASPYLPTLSLRDKSLWPYTDISMCSIYVPATVFWLAVTGLCLRPRQRWRWWLAGLGVGSLAFAMGQALPFRGWLYDLFPVFRFFRHSALFRTGYLFITCVLALLASRDIADLFSKKALSLRRLLAPGILAAAAAGMSFFYVVRMAGPAPDRGLAVAHIGLVWLGTCALAAAVTRPFLFRRALWMPVALVALTGLDVFLTQRLSVTVYDDTPANVQYVQWDTAHHLASVELTPFGLARRNRWSDQEPLNHNVFVKLPVLYGYSPMENRFHREWVQDPLLTLSAVQLPAAQGGGQARLGQSRIWFSLEAATVPLSDDLFRAFRERACELGTPPLVVHSPDSMKRPSGPAPSEPEDAARIARLPAAVPLAVGVMTYQPTRLTLEVESPGDGWLWVTDRWATGWRATVNGRPTPVWGGNFIFRAVRVGKGRNVVDFTYHPFAYPWLLILSWGTLGLVGGSASVSALRRRAERPPAAPTA